jgi:hypothetical protein
MVKKLLKKIYFKITPNNTLEVISLYKNQSMYTDKEVIFIHVPKAAGTSVALSLYGRSISHVSAKKFKKYFPKNFEGIFTFSIVRNPYERLYSAYMFLRSGGTKEVPTNTKKIYMSDELDSFEKFVVNYISKVNLKNEDYVLQPQFWFTHGNDKNQLVDKVWKLRNILDFVNHYTKLDPDYVLPHHNMTGNFKTIKEVYTPEMKELVDEIYSSDFELFNYKKKI